MASSGEFDLSSVELYADEVERLLICCHDECQYALSVAGSQVTTHLRGKHQIPQELQTGLTRHLKKVYPKFFRNLIELPPRDNWSQIHPQFRIYDKIACRECSYLTINYEEYSRHFFKEHLGGGQSSRKRTDSHYDDVYLQTWTRSSSGKYWTVKRDGSIIRSLAGPVLDEKIYPSSFCLATPAITSSWNPSTVSFPAASAFRCRSPAVHDHRIYIPLEEIQSLCDFGRVIARTDPPSFLLRWSDDGETVFNGRLFQSHDDKLLRVGQALPCKSRKAMR